VERIARLKFEIIDGSPQIKISISQDWISQIANSATDVRSPFGRMRRHLSPGKLSWISCERCIYWSMHSRKRLRSIALSVDDLSQLERDSTTRPVSDLHQSTILHRGSQLLIDAILQTSI